MVGTTTTAVETVTQETSRNQCHAEPFPQTGRILLEGGTISTINKAEVVQDPLIIADKPEASSHGKEVIDSIDAVTTETFPCKQEAEEVQGPVGVGSSTTIIESVHGILLIEHKSNVLLTEPGTTILEVVPDLVIKSNKLESPPHKIDAVIIEILQRKRQEEEQPGLDISQIRPKTNSERYIELIIQNREKQLRAAIDESFRTTYLHSNLTKWNFVFNTWPISRDSNVKPLPNFPFNHPSPRGFAKFTGGGQSNILWGETLADFFRMVNCLGVTMPLPRDEAFTSSMLYNWVRGHEADISPFTRRLMSLAEREDRPRVVPAYSIEQLIRNSEACIREQEAVSWTRTGRPDEKVEEKERDPWEIPESWPPQSVFSPSAYPSPWPFEPFKKQLWYPQEKFGSFIHMPKLQQYIPQHLLPETLVVHDPFYILDARKRSSSVPWIEKDDIVRTYKLKHQETKQPREIQDFKEYEEEIARVKSVRAAFIADPHSRTEMPDGMLYQPEPPTELTLGPCKPPVYAVYPPKPPQPAAKTAHLYISPAAQLGSGNHSYVYKAEFEVPRSFLVSEEICKECVQQNMKRTLMEEDGMNGERRDARWDELSGRYTVKVRGKPARNVMLGDEEHKFLPDSREVEVAYEGPYRAIQTTVGYQNLERAPYCEHLCKDHIHPLTTKVQVAAKISMQYDDHLNYEADNYRAFPKEFFEHYNGFNLVHPLTEPTPVGAIAPQFYGYYVLDKEDERNKERVNNYLSPILLVEDCGDSIDPEDLNQDDTRECISLFYRMHSFEYYHGSPFRRNIVRQPGPLSEHPLVRQANATAAVAGTSRVGSKWSYRLIDFGRTRHRKRTDSADYVEMMDNWEKPKMRTWLREGYPSSI